jgi:hypothetical protein
MADVPLTKGRKAIPHLPESEDQAFSMILALTSELAVMRERIDTLERLLERAAVLDAGAVDAFAPDADAAAARDTLRRRIIAKVMRPVRDAARQTAEARQNASGVEE